MSGSLLSTAQPRADQAQRAVNREQADSTPPPSAIDTIGAGINSAFDTIEDVQEHRLDRAYGDVVKALGERGVDKSSLRSWRFWLPQLPVVENRIWDDDAIWAQIEKQRQSDPDAFKEIGTREQFERNALGRNGNRARDLDTLARGGGLAGFAGGMIGSMADPVNIATLPIGGFGKTVAARVITEGLAQGGVTALQTPQIAAAHHALGERYGVREALWDIGTATAGGMAIRGGIEGAPRVDAAAYRALAPLREKIPGGTVTERDLARAFSRSVPDELRTPEQAAALHVLTRGEEIDTASPYRATHAGLDQHYAKLQDAMEALESAPGPAQVPAATLITPKAISTPGARPEATGRGFDMDRYVLRNRSAESSGSDTAAAETSSAYGRHQFLKGTWLEFYRKTFGDTGESNAAILRKRADGAVQDRVMRTFTAENVNALQRAGVPVTDGTVYLAHFLGVRDAIKVLRAGDDEPLRGIIDRGSMAANTAVFRNIDTPSELIAWAQRKMGAAAPVERAVENGASAADDGALDAALAAEEADVASRRAGLQDPELAAFEAADATPADIPIIDSDKLTAGLVDVLRPIVRETGGRSLNRTAELAGELGVSEQDLRAALDRMVGAGEIGVTKSGAYRRKAVPGGGGEDDLVRFVARNGGLSYDGLSALGREKGTSLGHDLRNSGNLDRFVPGIGPMLRPGGKGLDEMGELAWEQGFFGPPETTPRPTEREMIDTLDELLRTGNKRFAGGGEAEGAAPAERGQRRKGDLFQSDEHYDARRGEYDEAARAVLGRELTEEEFLDAFAGEPALPGADRLSFEEATQQRIVDMANRRLDDALDDAFLEVEDDLYELDSFNPDDAAGREGAAGGEGGGRQAADAGDAGEGRGGGKAGQRDPGQAELDQLEADGRLGPDLPESKSDATRFDADDGDGVRAIAESDWHDIRAQLVDPAIAERRAQEAQLAADAPLRGANKTGQEQDGTMGLGLFDAADQPTFDLDDGKGPRTAADIDAEIAADKAALEAMRSCLK